MADLRQFASNAAEALERLRSSADLASLGLTAAFERLTQRLQPLLTQLGTGSVSGAQTAASRSGAKADNLAASLPLVLINPPGGGAVSPPPPPPGSRTPSINTPSLADLSPATVTTPTVKGPAGGQGAGFPLPLPVRIVSMDAKASAQMAVLALPGQVATVAAQQQRQAGGGGGITQFAQNAGAQGASLFAQLRDAMTGFASSADPFISWPTYKASVEGLSISIGQMFTPALNEASRYIQQVTAYIDGLDATTKSYAARVVITGVSVLAGVAALYKLGQAFYAVAVAARAATVAMISNPVTAIIAATAAVAGLAAAWYLASNNANSAATAAGKVAGVIAGLRDAGSAEPQVTDLRKVSPETRKLIESASQKKSPTILGQAREALDKEAEEAKQAFEKADAVYKATQSQRDTAYAFDAAISKAFAENVREASRTISLFNAYPSLREGEIPKGVQLTPFQQAVLRERPKTMEQVRRVVGAEADARMSSTLVQEAAKLPDAIRDRVVQEFRSDIPSTYFTQGYTSAPLGVLKQKRPELLDARNLSFPINPAGSVMVDYGISRTLTQARERLDAISRLQNAVGGGGTTGGPMQALGSLPAPVISSSEALADRLQIAALKGDDLQAANMAKQLQALEQSNVLLKEVKDAIRDLRILPQWMY